ncbi:MAG: hypothetical protein HY874_07320 [Chloroflexi bacterium]|nr:hypothetical protein [Chloroflexota bacterium]
MPVRAFRLPRDALARVEAWWPPSRTIAACRRTASRSATTTYGTTTFLRSESGRLSGVLDIAHIEISDPAHDFAAPRSFGGTFMVELVISYRAGGGHFDAGVEYRAKRFHEAREFGGLA